MELILERTNDTARVGALPVTLWSVTDQAGGGTGLAMVVEIVAVPTDASVTAAMARSLLAAELAGPRPRLRLSPTDKIVEAGGTPARLWLGRTAGGLTIGAFIATVAAHDAGLQSALADALHEVQTRISVDDLAAPDGDVMRLLEAAAALR